MTDKLIQAVVFDLDGLMFNTEDIFDLSGNELLSRRGLAMTDECRRAMLGRRPEEAFEALRRLTGITEPTVDLMLETKEIFYGFVDDHLAPMPGLFALLELIDRNNLPRAVATSSPFDYMRGILERFDLFDGFKLHLAAEHVARGKPHPEIYETAAARLGIAPDEMLILEDSEAGTRAGAAAGGRVISIPNRHTQDGDFSSATHVVTGLDANVIAGMISRPV